LTFVLAWAAFPLVLAAVGLGFGTLVEDLSGARLATGALVVPVGLAAALVTAALLTTNGVSASFAVPVVGVLAVIGLVRARSLVARWPRPGWPALAALGVLVVYGAPVLASGTATFTGFIKLDDTSTWLAITAQLFAHGRSTAGLPPSVYTYVLDANLGTGAYPAGSFMLLGIGHGLTGVDLPWVFQPYLACAGAALSLCLYSLSEPLIRSRPLRALVAFVGAQPALLYGYSLWGGIKEMTAAFLVALLAALGAAAIRRPPERPRALLPLAVATAALIVTYGPGTAVWVVPAFGAIVVTWLVALARRRGTLRAVAIRVGSLAVATVVLSLPTWIVLAQSLRTDVGFVGGTAGQTSEVRLGNLHGPLSAFQLAGIWPVGDFRDGLATSGETIILIGFVLVAGLAALFASVRFRRHASIALYVGIALVGTLAIDLVGGVPWVVGKSLAIASPAVLFAGVAGGAMLWGRRRVLGAIVLVVIAGGVLWSNADQYNDATLAPSVPLHELAHIGALVDGKGPVFVNDYEVYADRYFMRNAVEPAEYRPVPLALRDGTLLDKPAAADLDSFGLNTLLPFPWIVTVRSPAESRPSSLYHLVWQGSYYELWERATQPPVHVIAHIPFGDSTKAPYCGVAVNGKTGAHLPLAPVCSADPVATAACPQVRLIGRYATRHHALIIADERPPSIVALGDQARTTSQWLLSPESHLLAAVTPGVAVFSVTLKTAGRYELWLDGDFGRGFDVTLDGRHVGRVRNELAAINGYVGIVDRQLGAGVHTIALSYSGNGLAPGSGDELGTTISAVALQPLASEYGRLVALSPAQATTLCGQSLDWVEIAVPQA
jgi:hypothetical protein